MKLNIPVNRPTASLGGTVPDDLEDDLAGLGFVEPPPPPIPSGDYLMIVSGFRNIREKRVLWIDFEITDEAQKKALANGETSYYGEKVGLRYPLGGSDGDRKSREIAHGIFHTMGYPVSSFPTSATGQIDVGQGFRLMRDELVATKKGFVVTVEMKAGTGASAGNVYTNIKKARPA